MSSLLWHTSSLHKRYMVRSWVQNPPCITNKENSEEVKSYRLEVQILLGETSERIFLFPPPPPPNFCLCLHAYTKTCSFMNLL